MTDPVTNEEKNLRNRREQQMVTAARKALDVSDTATALSLVEQTTGFWQENLITLMTIIGFQNQNAALVKRAWSLFGQHLGRCSKVAPLVFSALWLRNPARRHVLPGNLAEAIDSRRRLLEPGWDGVWKNPGLAGNNRGVTILTKSPREVFDPEDCLIGASQANNWAPWFSRYFELGGNPKDPKYLKLWVAKYVPLERDPTPKVKGMLREFVRVGRVGEVRLFLRNITPTRNSLRQGRNPNQKLAALALLLYCQSERLEHDLTDWVHIAKSAIYINHRLVKRIIQRILAEVTRDESAEEVYLELIQESGPIRVTGSAFNDIGIRDNSIWSDLQTRVPMNADARKILFAYSSRELELM